MSQSSPAKPVNDTCAFCDEPAQPEHSPCCSSTFHGKSLCCKHYCATHFVEVNQCSPEMHGNRTKTLDA